jgi:hypothetical protein
MTNLAPIRTVRRVCQTCRGDGEVSEPHCDLCRHSIPIAHDWWDTTNDTMPCGHSAGEHLIEYRPCPTCSGVGRAEYRVSEGEWRKIRQQKLLKGVLLFLAMLVPFVLLGVAIANNESDQLCGNLWYGIVPFLLAIKMW